MCADDRGPSSTPDLWSLLLGVAVIALTGVSALGWVELRSLGERVARLEGPANVGNDTPPAPSPAPPSEVGAQFTRLNAAITIRDSAFKGDPAAPFVIVEFSDFQCPFCARHVRETLKRIENRYIATGQVRYVFRHLPLEEIHPQAFMAAEVAECSRRQGLFWEIHDRFFTMQRELRAVDLPAHAIAAGVDRGPLEECLRGSSREAVLRDLADARSLGITGTPLFFVGRVAGNGTVNAAYSINGARPFEIFESVLTDLMRANGND